MRPRLTHFLPIAYGAGLLTGLLHFGAPAGVAMVIAAALATRIGAARGPMLSLLLLVAAVGWGSGKIAWARERSTCAARLPAKRIELQVRLVEPSVPEPGRLAVHPLAGCRGQVAARWPARHPLDAGRVVQVTARWMPRPGMLGRPGGTLLVEQVSGRADGSPTVAERLRGFVVRTTRELYGRRAPVVDALVVDRRGWLDRNIRQQFADSGLIHLLSISGFHVGLVAGWVVLLARLLRRRPAVALLTGAAVGLLYAAFLGWPPPATRAAVLAAVAAGSRVRQRKVLPGATLSFTCWIVLLVDPWALVSLGAWLSVASLWGAGAVVAWTDRRISRHALVRSLAASIGATVATAPITAGALGTVALTGVGLNLVAIPLAALAVPGVLASLLVHPLWPGLARAFAAGAGLALALLELLARFGAAVPGGHLVSIGGIGSAVPWLLGLGVLWYGLAGRTTAAEALRRWGWVATACAWIWLAGAVLPRPGIGASGLTLDFLNVGQGDAAVLRTPHGHWVVVDAGPVGPHDDAGRRVVVPFLRRHGAARIDVLVISHAHADHLGGARALLDRIPTGLITEPGELVSDSLYGGFLDEVAELGIPWRAGRPGDHFELDGVSFRFLHPDPKWAGWGTDLNEDSLVLLVEYGEFQALFSGDIGFPVERLLKGHVGPVDLLKVGHHGSAGSSSDAWLSELRPRAAVISVGAHNRYGHPAPSALARLAAHHIAVWRTDREGTIIAQTDGRTLTVRGRRGIERYSTSPTGELSR